MQRTNSRGGRTQRSPNNTGRGGGRGGRGGRGGGRGYTQEDDDNYNSNGNNGHHSNGHNGYHSNGHSGNPFQRDSGIPFGGRGGRNNSRNTLENEYQEFESDEKNLKEETRNTGVKRSRSQSSNEQQTPNKKVKKVVIEPTGTTYKVKGADGEDVDDQFLNDRIEVEGDVDVVPITSFTHPVINKVLAPVFEKFTAPTPVQQYTWPILFGKRDVIGLAKTGSGKTLAFGVPCALAITKQRTPSMLILAPTRELAIQIHNVMVELARKLNMKASVCYGGCARGAQEAALRGAHIVVATPGRLMDFMENQAIDVSKVTHFVLDEADLMLDMGFEPDVTFIESHLPPTTERQTAMFSATWPVEIQDLAARFLNNPIKISAGEASEVPIANKSITQHVEFHPYHNKKNRIKEILEETKPAKTLIFTTTKRECKQLADNLTAAGIRSLSISSDLPQKSRESVLNQFKSGQLPVLVATDVASRGLDIPHVDVVINLSFPQTVESYVHRIGRTGRAGLKGVAYTLLSPGESFPVKKFINILKQAEQVVPKELYNWKSNRGGGGGGGRGRPNRNGPLRNRQYQQDEILQSIASNPSTKAAVVKFLQSMKNN